jgi:hypothetical protein
MSQTIFDQKFWVSAENWKAVWAQAPRVGSFPSELDSALFGPFSTKGKNNQKQIQGIKSL